MSKKKATITKEQVLQAVRDRIKAQSAVDSINAQKRIEVSEAEERHAAKLVDHQAKVEECGKIIEEYVVEHREELLTGDAKSTDLGASKVGFRLNPAKPVILDGFKLADVLTKLKARYPDLVSTKVTESLESKKVVELVKDKGTDLKRFGIDVEQEEKFFIK
jgi:phage host-nuclease inhibitor protein Gam